MPVVPQRNRFHMPPAITMGALAFLAAMLLVAHPVSAQSETASCADGGAVLHAANNPGLVSDCNGLLAARDALAGSAALNWLANRPIDLWEGVTVGGSPLRVTELDLSHKGLTGEIPAELGGLSYLRWLGLFDNEFSGQIPAELGSLKNLRMLSLPGNQLTGPIPTELGNLSSLLYLYLYDNELTGPIPSELGRLSNLIDLNLSQNQLTGPIPTELGNLPYLNWLYLRAYPNNKITDNP